MSIENFTIDASSIRAAFLTLNMIIIKINLYWSNSNYGCNFLLMLLSLRRLPCTRLFHLPINGTTGHCWAQAVTNIYIIIMLLFLSSFLLMFLSAPDCFRLSTGSHHERRLINDLFLNYQVAVSVSMIKYCDFWQI